MHRHAGDRPRRRPARSSTGCARRSGTTFRSSVAAPRTRIHPRTRPTGSAGRSSTTRSPRARSRSCSSPGRWTSRSASRRAGAASASGPPSPDRHRTASWRSAGVRPSSSTTATSASASRRIGNPLAVFEDGDARLLPAHPDGVRSRFRAGRVPRRHPGGRDRPDHRRRDRRDRRWRASLHRGRAGELPRRPDARRRPAVLVRDPPVPPRDARGPRDRAGPRGAGQRRAGRRLLLRRRDRPDAHGRRLAVPQRHDGGGAPRRGASGDLRMLEKENRVLAAATRPPRGQLPPARGAPGLERDASCRAWWTSSRRSGRSRGGSC